MITWHYLLNFTMICTRTWKTTCFTNFFLYHKEKIGYICFSFLQFWDRAYIFWDGNPFSINVYSRTAKVFSTITDFPFMSLPKGNVYLHLKSGIDRCINISPFLKNTKFTGPSTKRQMFGENLFTGDGMMNWVIYVNSSFTLAAFLEKKVQQHEVEMLNWQNVKNQNNKFKHWSMEEYSSSCD